MFLFNVFVWFFMSLHVEHNGGFLPGIIMLTQCYYYRGTPLNAMKRYLFAAYDPT